MRRLGLLILIIAAAGGIAYGGMTLAADPRFALGDVQVLGAHRVPATDIIGAAALPRGRNVWLLDTGSATRAVMQLPWIASVQIDRDWPNQVTIAVAERVPAARVELGPGAYSLVDADGRVLSSSADPADEALPALSIEPLPPDAATAGAQLGQTSVGEALDAMRRLNGLGVHMTEVRSEPAMGFSAITQGGLRVVFGDLDDLAQKVALFDAISKRISQPDSVEYIDVRSTSAPTVQYR